MDMMFCFVARKTAEQLGVMSSTLPIILPLTPTAFITAAIRPSAAAIPCVRGLIFPFVSIRMMSCTWHSRQPVGIIGGRAIPRLVRIV